MVGSMSDRPCHAVTISGFFWSAKFFQIRSAPSSGGERGGDGGGSDTRRAETFLSLQNPLPPRDPSQQRLMEKNQGTKQHRDEVESAFRNP